VANAEVLVEERLKLQPLPAAYRGAVRPARPAGSAVVSAAAKTFTAVPPQHDLSVYDRLLEVAA